MNASHISILMGTRMLQRLKVPHTYCWSPSLIPKPADWGSHISISGFFFLDLASDYTPPIELQTFLDAGQPPVYIGFGSIVLDDPDAMTRLIFEAVEKTGQRVLLSKGWGGMGAGEGGLRVPEGVFMLGNVPHDWLFKQVSCVVHHGGAGTTAAGEFVQTIATQLSQHRLTNISLHRNQCGSANGGRAIFRRSTLLGRYDCSRGRGTGPYSTQRAYFRKTS